MKKEYNHDRCDNDDKSYTPPQDGTDEENDNSEDETLEAVACLRAVQAATCNPGKLAPLAAAAVSAIIPSVTAQAVLYLVWWALWFRILQDVEQEVEQEVSDVVVEVGGVDEVFTWEGLDLVSEGTFWEIWYHVLNWKN